jgi:hypothetical protein
MTGNTDTDRAALQLPDVFMSFLVLISMLALAPVIYQFIGMVRVEADPFSALLLGLVVPLLFLALILSMGVSAQGGS